MCSLHRQRHHPPMMINPDQRCSMLALRLHRNDRLEPGRNADIVYLLAARRLGISTH
jgi:hypothetical protein